MNIYKKITYLCFDYFKAMKNFEEFTKKDSDYPEHLNKECLKLFASIAKCEKRLRKILKKNRQLYEDLSKLS